MISVFRYYTLPVIVLCLGSLASYALYRYENHHEQQKFQAEFELRSEAHTSGIMSALHMFEQRVQALSILVSTENIEGIETIEQQKSILKATIGDEKAMRAVIWVSKNHTSGNLFNTPVPLSFLNDADVQKNIMLGLEKNSVHTSFYTLEKDQVWIIESFPIMVDHHIKGVLVTAWDIGVEIEKALHGLPVAGIDIFISSVVKEQNHLLHTHQSRSRKTSDHIDDPRMFQFSESSQLMQHVWNFSYQSAPIFLQQHQAEHAKLLFMGGLLLTLLTAWLSVLLYKRGRIIREQVDQKTKALKQSEHRVTLLVHSIAEGLYDMDIEGRCTFINQRALDMFGYDSKEDVLGKDVHELFHHSHHNGQAMSHDNCKIMGLLKAVEAVEAVEANNEVFWKSDHTSFPVAYRATSILNEQEHTVGVVVTFLDISEQIKDHQEAEALRMQVEHTQRLESLGVLAGGIAHDFNNLLSVIMGNVDIARMNITQPSDLDRPLERVEKASQRAADLCKQMLAYAGEGRFVIQPLNISEVIQDIGQLLDVSMGKAVRLHYQLSHPTPLVEADKSQLQQVAMNLLTNANEAMDETLGGNIFVKTGLKTLNETDIQHAYGEWKEAQAGDFVYLEVKDDGCGMSEETQKKVFDPFYTTKFTGRGLGMSAILGIVRGHHGVLTLDSTLNQGTTITVYLPAMPSLTRTLEDQSSLNAQATMLLTHDTSLSTASKTQARRDEALILVVDDEDALREMTGLMLEDMGYDVIYAVDGKEAVDIYEKEQQQIDLIVLDMTMPNMNGATCLEKIHAIRHDVPVLLVSGYHETEFQHLGEFLGKPFSAGDLKHKISKLLKA